MSGRCRSCSIRPGSPTPICSTSFSATSIPPIPAASLPTGANSTVRPFSSTTRTRNGRPKPPWPPWTPRAGLIGPWLRPLCRSPFSFGPRRITRATPGPMRPSTRGIAGDRAGRAFWRRSGDRNRPPPHRPGATGAPSSSPTRRPCARALRRCSSRSPSARAPSRPLPIPIGTPRRRASMWTWSPGSRFFPPGTSSTRGRAGRVLPDRSFRETS